MYRIGGITNNYNIRKGFLNPASLTHGVFNADFDEPTYLTFKVNCYSDENFTDNMLYDTLPQGLFTQNNCGVDSLFNATSDVDIRKEIINFQSTPNNFRSDRAYSAVRYLLDKNEDMRAFFLVKFIKGFNELQEQFQYYFQKISGLDTIFKAAPDKGAKIEKDATITIECLEGIDQKVKYLMSLYRTAAWDEEYQRWILPDIYRYFKMDIYISECRTFHISNKFLGKTGKVLDVVTNAATTVLGLAVNKSWAKRLSNITNTNDLINYGLGLGQKKLADVTNGGLSSNTTFDDFTLNVLNGIAPVTCIHCELCDFDVVGNLYGASYGTSTNDQEKTTLTIKVKKAEVIYNWTKNMIDRVWGNLYTKDERSFSTFNHRNDIVTAKDAGDYLFNLASAPAPKDYLSQGVLSQDYFNSTFRMADKDKKHNYTGTIISGWMGDTLNSTVDALKDFKNSGSILNLANNLINTTKSTIDNIQSRKKDARDGKLFTDVKSKATEGSYSQESLDGAQIKVPYISMATTVDKEKEQLLQDTLNYIAQAVTQNGQSTDELTQQTMTLLENFGQSYKDLSQSTQEMLQDAINSIQLTALRDPGNVDSSITDVRLVGNVGQQGLNDLELVGGVVGNIDMTRPNGEGDRSWATELDGGPYGDLTPLSPTDLLLQMADVRPIDSSLDLSLNAPEIQGEDDRSWATELDGGPYGDLTVPIINDLSLNLNAPEIQGEDDRSWATDLDGGPYGDLTVPVINDLELELNAPNIQEEPDRSWATDLDGGPYGDLTVPIINDLELEMHAPNIQEEPDRSWATDLDGGPYGELTVPIINDLELEMHAPDIQEEPDRSWATDLDGGPYGDLTVPIINDLEFEMNAPEIQEEPDRSWATDLDGGPYGELISPIDSDINLEMHAPNIQEETDRSWATDLDGGPYGELISPIDSGVDVEMNAPEIFDSGANLSLNAPELQKPYNNIEMNAPDILDNGVNVSLNAPELQEAGLNLAMNAPEIQDNGVNVELNAPEIVDNGVDVNLHAPEIQDNGVNVELNAPEIIDNGVSVSMNAPEIQDNGVNVSLNAPEIQGLDVDPQMNAPEVKGTELNLSMNAPEIVDNGVNVELNAPEIQDNEVNVSLNAPEIEGLEVEPKMNAPEIVDNGVNVDLNAPEIEGLEVEPKMNAPEIVDGGINVSLNAPEIRNNEPNVSLNAPEIKGLEVEPKMNAPELQNASVELQMNAPELQKSEVNHQLSAPDLQGADINPQLNAPDMFGTDVKLQMAAPGIQEEIDRSMATDLDGGPKGIEHVSLFEKIASSQATVGTHKLETRPLINKESDKVLLDGGIINPEAKVSDIINQFVELQKYEQKKSIESVELTGGQPKKTLDPVRPIDADSNKEKTIL